jgi:hypothetical protein
VARRLRRRRRARARAHHRHPAAREPGLGRPRPALLVLFARRHFTHNNKPNRTAAFDAGAAWMSLALQAGRLGLHAHALAGFDTARAYTELGVDPETHEALAAIAVGQRDEPDALPEPLRAPRGPERS